MNYIISIFFLIFIAGCSVHKEVAISPLDRETNNRTATVETLEDTARDVAYDSQEQAHVPHERATTPIIVDAPVTWGFRRADRHAQDIDTVIIHSVYNPHNGQKHALEDIIKIFKNYGVAPHYIITRDGVIHRTVAEHDIAYHAGRSRVPDGRTNVNDFSIGIEMINSLDDVYTDAQYGALRWLLEDIKKRYDITYILGHDEVEVHDPWHFEWARINDLRHAPREE